MDVKLRDLIAHEGEKGGLALHHVDPRMNVLHKVTLTSIGATGWRSYLDGKPALYRLDPKGPEARVHWIGSRP